MIPEAKAALDELMEGNRRFREGRPHQYRYSPARLSELATAQTPKAAIVACADSRVSPEIIFDQPLGTIFASRVPANVASDSAKWMLELAVGEFKVPLVIVMGHTGCLAVGQLLDGDKGGAGGLHRFAVLNAVYRAKGKRPSDLYRAAVEENASQTVEHLARDLYTLRSAIREGTTSIVSAIYDMHSGEVQLLHASLESFGLY